MIIGIDLLTLATHGPRDSAASDNPSTSVPPRLTPSS
jgi:hypothetical protein